MKIYSEMIGPKEYFRGIGFVCFFLPYAMGVPQWWPICVMISVGAFWTVGRIVKKEESALRAARHGDPRIAKVVLLFWALMFTNAGLIRLLR